MNELHEKFAEKGLVVVGVTNEEESKVRKFIEEQKVKHPVTIVEGNATDQAYDVKGFPSGALVAPSGEIVWLGHPANVPMDKIEEALAKVYFVPPLPARFGAINAEVAKKNFGKAHAAIEKELAKASDEALSKAKEAIEKMLAAKTAEADRKAAEDDYAAAADTLDDVGRMFKGMPGADEASKKLKEWKADKTIKAKIKGGEDFKRAEALEKLGDPQALRKAYSIYVEIARALKGHALGAKAQAAADRLKSS